MKKRGEHGDPAPGGRNGNGGAPAAAAQGGERDAFAEPASASRARDLPAEIAGESSDTLTMYLREVRRTELFTPQQEFETAGRARAGDFSARQSMIEHNLRLVVS